jgi:hypothetical protein
MVRIGFICEGETEKIIVESERFRKGLSDLNLEFVKAIDATGNGNLLPQNITAFIHNLEKEGAEKVLILTDLDEDQCITLTKERIDPLRRQIIVISIRQIEAWFLADSTALSAIFHTNFHFTHPEKEDSPKDTLQNLFMEHTGRGIGPSKPKFAKKMMTNGFDVFEIAKHANCTSARYFVDKLKQIGEGSV